MYAHLPEPVKQQVLRHLTADNFTAAKEIHDAWVTSQRIADDYELNSDTVEE